MSCNRTEIEHLYVPLRSPILMLGIDASGNIGRLSGRKKKALGTLPIADKIIGFNWTLYVGPRKSVLLLHATW